MFKIKAIAVCILFALLSLPAYPQEQPGRVKPGILKCVVKITGPSKPTGEMPTGTGFIVSRPATSGTVRSRRFFLVTNKHLVGDWNLADMNIEKYHPYINVFFYREGDESKKNLKPERINLLDAAGNLSSKVRPHPVNSVDIAIIELDTELSPASKIDLVSFDASYLQSFDQILPTFTGIGDQVFALGYPLGITSLRDNYPIAKSAYISSLPGTELSIEVKAYNRRGLLMTTVFEGKLLLLDGLIVGGNSGGPILLPSEIKIRMNAKTKMLEHSDAPTQNLVIGIVSAGMTAAGMGVIFSCDYILELIDNYYK